MLCQINASFCILSAPVGKAWFKAACKELSGPQGELTLVWLGARNCSLIPGEESLSNEQLSSSAVEWKQGSCRVT